MNADQQVAEWIRLERELYAKGKKFAEGTAGRDKGISDMYREGYGDGWDDFVQGYLKRARLLDIRNENGRQALGKAITTLMHCLETAVEVYGPLPKPGVPSGQIEEWVELVQTDVEGG